MSEELTTIIEHSAHKLEVEIEPDGAYELARRSRGTPRLANRLLKRVRDFAQVKYDGVITERGGIFCTGSAGSGQAGAGSEWTATSC